MASRGFEQLRVYQMSERMSDAIWDLVVGWDEFARNTVGRQLVRAADSIGANIAEGTGRGTYKDNRHFARVGRGSLNETRHFLRPAFRRKLLTEEQISQIRPLIEQLGPSLNAYIKSIGTRRSDDGDPRSSSLTSDQ
jgi:four helix bundle protein